MSRLSKLLSTLASWAPLLGLCGGCSDAPVPAEELIGTWMPDGRSAHLIKAENDRGRCRISLARNGRFSATVPDYLIYPPSTCSWRMVQGDGEWTLGYNEYESTVKLWFVGLEGRRGRRGANELRVLHHGDGYALRFWLREPGLEEFGFVKETASR